MSTDEGKTFAKAGEVQGTVRAMCVTSSGSNRFTFWAVGDHGLVLRAAVANEVFDPTTLVWEKVDIGYTGNLTGISFSFDAGLIVGSNGYIVQTNDAGKTFSTVSNVRTTSDLNVLFGSYIGGNGVIMNRSPISGMPVGSYKWWSKEGTDYPNITALRCLGDCIAVGYTDKGAIIMSINGDNGNVIERQAEGIHKILRSIDRTVNGFIAVGDSGTAYFKAKE
jgi:photosystem II stability/assembly factor-like uncharacterized protein